MYSLTGKGKSFKFIIIFKISKIDHVQCNARINNDRRNHLSIGKEAKKVSLV